MKRADIVAEARKWLDVPFMHQGRNRQGVDCVGLVQMVGDAFDIEYDDMVGYARAPTDLKFLLHLKKYMSIAPIGGNKIGMVGTFRQSKFPCHIGIFASDEAGRITLINSRVDRRKVVEEIWIDNENSFNLVSLLQFPGLED